ncbi:MAG TPA: septum formation protein Maf [Deltaproteobacteria bacterium]|nr:septum formation protein Maf [Deltaproteobacteria bacterium]
MLQQNRPLCLASSSPRRQELLTRFGLDFLIQSPDIDESMQSHETPEAFVTRMALEKAQQVVPDHPECITLSGDTVVVLEGGILGKPLDRADSIRMLERLSGKTHEVFTAYALMEGISGPCVQALVRTRVSFRTPDPELIRAYVQTGETDDKAGAYSIQGLGALLVSSIEGSYSNVVGFPIERILDDMMRHGWLTCKPL